MMNTAALLDRLEKLIKAKRLSRFKLIKGGKSDA